MKVSKTLFKIVALGIFLAVYDVFIKPFYVPLLQNYGVTGHLGNDQITRVTMRLPGTANVLEAEYSFLIPEIWTEASIRILGATISLWYYLPIL